MDLYEEVALSEKLKDNLKEISDMLSKIAPLSELRPVTFCKDCRYCERVERSKEAPYIYVCRYINIETEENNYCSHAERKEE